MLSQSLRRAVDAIVGGERDAAASIAIVREIVATEPRVELEYVEVRDADELTPLTALDGAVLLAVAARLGATRLIDNVSIQVDGTHVSCRSRYCRSGYCGQARSARPVG